MAPEKLGRYLRELRALLDEYDYQATFYGHFGHGCIHMQVSFDLQSAPGVREVRRVRRARRRPGRDATAGRFQANTATASRAARCCRRCSARS